MATALLKRSHNRKNTTKKWVVSGVGSLLSFTDTSLVSKRIKKEVGQGSLSSDYNAIGQDMFRAIRKHQKYTEKN